MRLDFNILWVEDQPAQVNAQRESIERQMRTQGFKLQTQFVSSVEGAARYLGDSIFKDHVDLVLMDYQLDGDADGEQGLEVVREQCPFKDIVFYSAKEPTALKSVVASKEISGVFCTHRNGLVDTVVGIFGVLVKKVLDIDHSRGIVMGATSEIDDFINRSLEAHLAKSDDTVKAQALEIAKKDLVKIRKEFEEEFAQIEALTDLGELRLYHRIYSSVKRLILLRKLLKASGRSEIEINAMLDYERTVPRRNLLAHVTVIRDGFKRRIEKRDGTELTVEDMRALRVELLEHHEAFEALLKSL